MAQPAIPVLTSSDYATFVNPQWQRLLAVLGMDVRYDRCSGAELLTRDGRRIVDFLSGYCVHNTGHNHPEIIAAIKAELDRSGPAMLQSHIPELAGELAARLCERAGGQLSKVFFCSSGSEGVESAIKFARAKTGRTGLLYNHGAFHGLTCGALSMMGDPFWRGKFGPMLSGTQAIPFADVEALDKQLATRQFAAFFMEPIQSEGGIRVPTREYMQAAQRLCRKHGTLFVLDEVQTGMYRTGPFLAMHHFDVDPDMVVLAKALSGGLIPVGAVLMSDAVYKSVFDSLRNSIIHASTFSENSISMRAGLATLQVLERYRLGERAAYSGEHLRLRLRAALSGYEMIQEVRGAGLLSGIAFAPPRRLKLRVPFEAFRKIHPGMFGQVLVMRMFRDHGFLTQMCGNNFMVLKVAPPLVVADEQIDAFVSAIHQVVDLAHSSNLFWTEALGSGTKGDQRLNTDILVIGGGPAGLAAAIATRRRGFNVTVVDRVVPPADKTCGEGLMPDALAALSNLGVSIGDADSFPFRGIRFLDRGTAVDASFPAGCGRGVRRTTLHRLMIERAEAIGVNLHWGARLDFDALRCGWVIGADGEHSLVRKWAGLDRYLRDARRFGFRRHYRIEPWTDRMELYWGRACQVYVTPVTPDSVCVTAISRDSRLRLDAALLEFPDLARNLQRGAPIGAERGAIAPSRKLRAIYRDRVALIGDASGSVDAITGEGLCMAFRQAAALAEAIEFGNLAAYQRQHCRIARRPEWMAKLLLTLGDCAWARLAAMRALAAHPGIFAKMLAIHVGALYEIKHSDLSDGVDGLVWAGVGARAESGPDRR